jgi:hypothetical protein
MYPPIINKQTVRSSVLEYTRVTSLIQILSPVKTQNVHTRIQTSPPPTTDNADRNSSEEKGINQIKEAGICSFTSYLPSILIARNTTVTPAATAVFRAVTSRFLTICFYAFISLMRATCPI